MSLRPEEYYAPPTSEGFVPYIRLDVAPPVDPSRLGMELLVGDQRKTLKTPTTGEMSLALSYRLREGYVASLSDHGDVLGIVQLQGATRSKGYRVATGVDLIPLFAREIHEIATHPESPYREIYMPPVHLIEGVEVAISDFTQSRYMELAAELGMKFSAEEQLFLKKIR